MLTIKNKLYFETKEELINYIKFIENENKKVNRKMYKINKITKPVFDDCRRQANKFAKKYKTECE